MTAVRSYAALRSRGEARVLALIARLKKGWPHLVGIGFWVAAPLFCLYVISVGIGQLVNNADGKIPGIIGTFSAVSHNCQDQLCVTSGTFTSDDGRFVEQNLIGNYRWPIGSVSPAVYNTSSGEILDVAPSWDPTPTITGLIGAFAFLALWLCILTLAVRSAAPARPGPAYPELSPESLPEFPTELSTELPTELPTGDRIAHAG